ncbi:MAG: transketolase, partial [Deltaproteobacteria bacterium]|nr:transketolase [Deltaproteobacteria bacterium]
TDIAFTEDVALRFKSYNWHVLTVDDGNDIISIKKALEESKAETQRPSMIMLRTQIAFGSPNKQGSADAHGAPLGEEEVRLTKERLEFPADDTFHVPQEVFDFCQECVERGKTVQSNWEKKFEAYKTAYPDLAEHWTHAMNGTLPPQLNLDLPEFRPADGPIATRAASGKVLNAMAKNIPLLIGGSADLAPSNKTVIDSSFDFQKGSYNGRNIRFGVREHAMGGILNGISLHGGVKPYGGTFLVFADYMRSSIRLAALMKLPVIYVFTHDSIAVGEDGPTHQPVEHVASLRAIPGLTVIRPADALETAEAWRLAVKNNDGPVALILSRQKLPILDRTKYASADRLGKGAYVLADSDRKPEIILIATGSEVSITLEAGKKLKENGSQVRVVSMPSWELFEKNPQEYKDEVLLPDVTARIAVEAGLSMGWERYVANAGATVCISRFGASAPGQTLLEKFGFTSDNIVQKAKALLNH